MNVTSLQIERKRLRDRLRRAALDQIIGHQVLDLEDLLDVMADPFGGNRARLLTLAYVARGLVAAGATTAQIAARQGHARAEVEAWLTWKEFADPAAAAAVERAVVEQLPATLLRPEDVDPKDRALARSNPEGLLR